MVLDNIIEKPKQALKTGVYIVVIGSSALGGYYVGSQEPDHSGIQSRELPMRMPPGIEWYVNGAFDVYGYPLGSRRPVPAGVKFNVENVIHVYGLPPPTIQDIIFGYRR